MDLNKNIINSKNVNLAVKGQIFNAGWENKSVNNIANDVIKIIGEDVKIVRKESNDNRSYHISSSKIKEILNFHANFTIKDAVEDLKKAFDEKYFDDTLNNDLYFNIKRMKNNNLI